MESEDGEGSGFAGADEEFPAFQRVIPVFSGEIRCAGWSSGRVSVGCVHGVRRKNFADNYISRVTASSSRDSRLRMSGGPHLAYTIAFDPPGSSGHRVLARLLASSLRRTFFNGDVIVFRNSEAPLFLVERKGLEEVFIETPDLHGPEGVNLSQISCRLPNLRMA